MTDKVPDLRKSNGARTARQLNAFVLALLCAQFVIPTASADNTYFGLLYGQATSEDIDTENLGIQFGRSPDKGVGFEFFYAPTIDEDEISAGPISADISLDTFGLLVHYKTGADDFGGYIKLSGGVAVVDLEFDFGDLGTLDDDTSGFAYGLAIGTRLGQGALELSYLILPDFDEFEDIDVDAEVDIFSISYLYYFE